MFDKIININEKVIARDVEVYVGDEKIATTTKKNLNRFFEELRIEYTK